MSVRDIRRVAPARSSLSRRTHRLADLVIAKRPEAASAQLEAGVHEARGSAQRSSHSHESRAQTVSTVDASRWSCATTLRRPLLRRTRDRMRRSLQWWGSCQGTRPRKQSRRGRRLDRRALSSRVNPVCTHNPCARAWLGARSAAAPSSPRAARRLLGCRAARATRESNRVRTLRPAALYAVASGDRLMHIRCSLIVCGLLGAVLLVACGSADSKKNSSSSAVGSGGASSGSATSSSAAESSGSGGTTITCQGCFSDSSCAQAIGPCIASDQKCTQWGKCVLACTLDAYFGKCLAKCDALYPEAAGTYETIYACICKTECEAECASLPQCLGAGGAGASGSSSAAPSVGAEPDGT